MVDILLINPTIALSQWESKLGSKLSPMGLLSLASYVREKNISVKIIDAYNTGVDVGTVLGQIKVDSPAYVGITATTNMIYSAAQMAKEIKKSFPDIITIIGGSHVTALPEDTIEQFPHFDVGIYGEGEKTLFDLIVRDKIDENIDGIVFRNNGKITKTAVRDYIKNLDDLPFPAYDLLPDFPGFYRPSPNNYSRLPIAPVISSRGCPYSCSFCAQSVFGRHLRACSIDYLISLLEYMQNRYGIKEVCFFDDIFLLNKKKLYEFIEKKEKSNLDISWSCEGRADRNEERLFRDMRKAGCWQISFGLESGSQKILDYFNKKMSVDKIWQTLNSVNKANIKSRAYFIIGSPPETVQTLEDTRKLALKAPLNEILISFFTPLPGSVAYNDIFASTKIKDFSKIDTFLINYIPPNLNEEILAGFMNRVYKSFYLHPKRLIRYFFMLFNYHKTIHLINALLAFIKLTFGKRLPE